ncbi:Zinc finger protein, putative [Gryllus bimaculatus]|nr:Zinc finger protein, putative [Gryllus bimaculatus]
MTRDCLCSFRHCIHLTEMELLQFVENSNSFGNIASLGPQCIVCNCGSLSTYVDLGLMTSVTSQTETPLKEKIKNILNNKWVSGISETAFSLCLQCFHLVDQYDSLEAQMKIIHNEICNKYVNGHGIIHSVQTCEKPESQHCIASAVNGDRTKRTTSSKRTSGSKRKKASLDNIPTLHAQIVQPLAVYDEGDACAAGLRAGERVRVGTALGEGEGQGLACSYCSAAAFPDAAALRQHARLVHRPRVLSAALPPHLGLGARANCGVELSAVQPRPGAAHARPFVCIACDGAFKFKSNLQLHFKDKHSPHTPFACADCRAAFRRPIELSRHRVYYCPLRKRAPDPAPPARKR